ncbi:hypothetical protein P5V15_011862 [Pogonomyrmex californicus]
MRPNQGHPREINTPQPSPRLCRSPSRSTVDSVKKSTFQRCSVASVCAYVHRFLLRKPRAYNADTVANFLTRVTNGQSFFFFFRHCFFCDLRNEKERQRSTVTIDITHFALSVGP